MIDWNQWFNGYEKKNREGDEGAKPHGRWRDEGERELEIKACERERLKEEKWGGIVREERI